jgi:hypothetical protein
MMADTIQNIEIYQKSDEFMSVFRSAVQKAQAMSRLLGVANVYVINGERYYELPNGDYSRSRPRTPEKSESNRPMTPE